MRYRITNNPNYDVAEKQRLEAEREAKEKEQAMQKINLNLNLDIVQRALDQGDYHVSYRWKYYTIKKEIMVIVHHYYDWPIPPVLKSPGKYDMDALASAIGKKVPSWKVKGFNHATSGNCGVYIYCSPFESQW